MISFRLKRTGTGHRTRMQVALGKCSELAKDEFKVASRNLKDAEKVIAELKRKVDHVIESSSQEGKADQSVRHRLTNISSQLSGVITKHFGAVQDTLDRKRHRLAKYTVTLFGRTMVGKSTIREALTRGDGGTIGKGAQRTTRSVHEYEWEHLQIVDTPGIGAFDGEIDKAIALEAIEESDLVLFLVSSDPIQESTFRAMKELRNRCKQMVFVLNIKQDLTNPLFRRRFLRDPGTVFNEKDLQSHANMINKFAGQFLGMRHVQIIPIHAQAAFMATRPEYTQDRLELHRLSRMDELLGFLENDVVSNGQIRRLRTLLDGTIVALESMSAEMRQHAEALQERGRYLHEKFDELDNWLKVYLVTTRRKLGDQVAVRCDELRKIVSSFVDENIERENVGELWGKRVKSVLNETWLTSLQKDVMETLQLQLNEFERQMKLEQTLNADLSMPGISRNNPWDIKRGLGWVSAGSGLVSGIAVMAFSVTAATWWSPVGWVAFGVGVGAGLLSLFFGNREKKLQKAKAKAAENLRKQVGETEDRIRENVLSWFSAHIEGKLVKGIRVDTKELYEGLSMLADCFKESARNFDKIVDEANIRIGEKSAMLLGQSFPTKDLIRISRVPGAGAKLPMKQSVETQALFGSIGRSLTEWWSPVTEGPASSMVAQSLVPAHVEPGHVTIDGQEATVLLPGDQAGLAIGARGWNVQLAGRLLNLKIKVNPEGKSA